MGFLRLVLLIATAMLAACGGGSDVPATDRNAAPAPTLAVSRFSVLFMGFQNSNMVPNAEVVNVAMVNGSFFIRTSQTGTMFAHSFSADSSGGRITITPAYSGEAGIFTGTIIVNGCSNATGPCNHVAGSPRPIDVTYNASGLHVTPAQLSFSSTVTMQESQTVTLAVNESALVAPVHEPWSWQISPSSANWLSIVPSGGAALTLDSSTPSQTVSVTANRAGLSPGVYGATVAFSTQLPRVTTYLTVTLTVGDPSVNFVAPYVVPAGVGGDVIIRGRGFSVLSPDSLSVQFNSTPASSASIVSDTEIRAAYPALAAGKYSISVSSGGPAMPSRAELKLVVVDPPRFEPTTITRPASAGWPTSLIYDAERQALLFVDPVNNRILRYALSDSGSTALDTAGAGGRIALSPDGTELLKTRSYFNGRWTLLRLDPVTLAVLSSVEQAAALDNITFANDGGALGVSMPTTVYRYDMLTQAVTAVSLQWIMRWRQIVASADGGRLMLLNTVADVPTDKRLYTYDATTGTLTPQRPTTLAFNAASMSRNASRIIFVNDSSPTPIAVYDAAFNIVGTLPNGAVTFVLSPDGNVAYAYYPVEGRVRKFDVSAGVSEVGAGSAVAPANTGMSDMAISPDGGSLFLIGKTSVVITPAP